MIGDGKLRSGLPYLAGAFLCLPEAPALEENHVCDSLPKFVRTFLRLGDIYRTV